MEEEEEGFGWLEMEREEGVEEEAGLVSLRVKAILQSVIHTSKRIASERMEVEGFRM